MATYTPAAIVPVTALTATPGTSVLTGSGGTTYIVRTFHFSTSATSKTVTVSFGADAAGTRILDAYALTQAVPAIFNGWWVKAGAGAHDIDASVSATTAQIMASGYTYA